MIEGLNRLADAYVAPIRVTADYVDRISKGEIPAKITDTYHGDFNVIKTNLNACIDAVNLLVTDAKRLASAAVEGKLATRADATRHQGDFRNIVEGVNATLDAVIGPLNVAADYVDRIAKGAIPAKITDRYNGDFNALKDNLNTCIDAVNLLVDRRQAAGGRGGGGPALDPRRRDPAPGRLPHDRRRRQRDPGRGHRPAQRGRRLCGPDLEGRDPREDHRALQRRLQCAEGEPQHLHRRGRRVGRGRPRARVGRGGGSALDPRRRDPAPGRLPQDRRRRQRHARRRHRPHQRGGGGAGAPGQLRPARAHAGRVGRGLRQDQGLLEPHRRRAARGHGPGQRGGRAKWPRPRSRLRRPRNRWPRGPPSRRVRWRRPPAPWSR